MLRWKGLTLEIHVRSYVDDLPDRPTESDSHDAAENAHRARFREKKFLDVTVAGSDGFHDANFTAALEDGHHQRVYDPDKGDRQGKAAEDSEKYVQHFEELLDAAAGIKDRESIEAHFLDGIFHLLHLARIFHPHAHRGIEGLISGGPGN